MFASGAREHRALPQAHGLDDPVVLVGRQRLQRRLRRHEGRGRGVRPERVPARRRQRLSHVLHRRPRSRGARQRLDLPRPDAVRAPGGGGGHARRPSADAPVPVVAPPRRICRRGGAAMSERDGFQPGVPCWVAAVEPDPAAAAAFYTQLFGWDATNLMPPEAAGDYYVCRLRGRDVAAVVSQHGAPPPPQPAWATHVQVDSADATVAAATAAGGTLIGAPFDSPGG